MAEITNGFFEALNDPKAAMWSAGVAFNRSNPLPLDKWSVFQTIAEAEAYAESNAVAYPGQLIAVVDNGKMVAMILAEDAEAGKLVPQQIGIIPTGEGAVTVDEETGKISIGVNDATIEVVEGKLTLLGFAGAEEGAQLLKKDGKLAWVKPDATTVEGLQTAVSDLQADAENAKERLTALETAIGKEAEGETAATGLIADVAEIESRVAENETNIGTLETDLGTLEGVVGDAESGLVKDVSDIKAELIDVNSAIGEKANAADVYTKSEVYTKGETDNAIAVAVADAEHLKRKTFNTITEAETFIAQNALTAEQYIYMIPVEGGANGDKYDEYMYIDGALERVGDWEVNLSDYAKASDLNDLTGEVNGIKEQLPEFAKAADVEQALGNKADASVLANYATNDAVAGEVAKLATKEALGDLESVVNEKVNAEEGKSLVADTEIAKLATVGENAEENYIKSVEETQLKVEDAKLSIIGIDQTLIGGLTNEAGEADTLINILAEKANASALTSAVNDINAALDNKVLDPKDGSRLITPEEQTILSKLDLGEDDQVQISGTVNAANVKGLYDDIVNIVTGEGQGTYDGVVKDLLGIEAGAQVNLIEAITLAGEIELDINNKIVDIPLAMGANAGLVKSSAAENKISVGEDGTMEVNEINANKLVQTAGEYLILDGGSAQG